MSSDSVFDARVTVDPATPVPHLRGVVFIHACPKALSSHVEWALANLLGPSVRLDWVEQPVISGTVRTEIGYRAPVGTAAKVASELRVFPGIRFEVTQEPCGSIEGERYAFTPSLGIFRCAIGVHGDAILNEERVRGALARAARGADLAIEIHQLLGTDWDEELESFRYAGEGAEVRWMHEVG